MSTSVSVSASICPARSATARRQLGAATLGVTMLLLFAMALVAMFVNRNLVFEQRTAANQYRSTQAFEAAEAGLEWAISQLNQPGAIDASCQPSSAAGATTFRARYFSVDATHSLFTPRTWANGGTPTPLQPGCVRGASGWACSCPAQGQPALAAPAGNPLAPAFTLRFQAGTRPGTVRVLSTGCTAAAGACAPGSASRADATASVQVDLGLLPAVHTLPVAALTARAAVNADTTPIGLHNPDPATGIAVQAGGNVNVSLARLTAPAGASIANSVVANDAALAGLSPDRFFMSYFGLDKAGWRDQATVTRVDCRTACSAALQAAVMAAGSNAVVWVDGNLALTGPLTLGTPQAPVVIVVNGSVQIDGAVELNGLLYASALSWDHTSGSGAVLRGAAISEAGYQGSGAPELFYDAPLLAALKGATGSFARVSGSWRDF